MLIGYLSDQLRRTCEEIKRARKALPQKPATTLIQRLTDLAAFGSLASIPSGAPLHFHALCGNLAGHFAISIDKKHRIVFRPTGKFDLSADGSAVLATVAAIEITYVGDYHDE